MAVTLARQGNRGSEAWPASKYGSIAATSKTSSSSSIGFGSRNIAGERGSRYPTQPPCALGRKVADALPPIMGPKIVGSIFSIPYSLRIRSSVHSIPIITGFTVDPDHRRVACPWSNGFADATTSWELVWHRRGRGRPDVGLVSLLVKIRTCVSAEVSIFFPHRPLVQDTGARRVGARRHNGLGTAGQQHAGPSPPLDPASS